MDKYATPVPRQYLSVTEFCAAHGISRSFLYSLWNKGQGPEAIRVGTRRLIPASARLVANEAA